MKSPQSVKAKGKIKQLHVKTQPDQRSPVIITLNQRVTINQKAVTQVRTTVLRETPVAVSDLELIDHLVSISRKKSTLRKYS